ncbi:MAG: hypothetical protein MHMPM18_004116 [Marteilia pararefringens]
MTSTAILVAANEDVLEAYIRRGCRYGLNWSIWNKFDDEDPAVVALSEEDRENCKKKALLAKIAVIAMIVIACIVLIVIFCVCSCLCGLLTCCC